MSKEIKGYKVLKPDYTCRNKKYSCPGEFEENVVPVVCQKGMHFCLDLVDCFRYYDFDPDNKVVEVIAYGDVSEGGDKCATNKLRIVREISWEEVLRMVNTGKSNSGRWNSGNRNSGDWNSGDWNRGNRNSGNRNSGNRNSGNRNSGDCNSGNRNSGNRNSGDWNRTSFSSGCFNTEEAKILMFNKPSEWTYRDWLNSEARKLMLNINFNVVEWIWESDMTDDEKEARPEYKTIGGYLKEVSNEESCVRWWDNLTDREKAVIVSIPNFDPEIFKQITGIEVTK